MAGGLRDRPEWLSRIRLVDEVAEELRMRIVSGHYSAGEPLRQVQIADDLNVSRTPLREALRMLERDGYVTPDANGGVSVTASTEQRLIDAYHLREVVDGLAARLAAERHAAKIGPALRGWIVRQRAAFDPWDPLGYTEANVDFHAVILEAAGNEFLVPQLAILRMTLQVLTPRARISRERVKDAIKEHEAIVAAIESGNPARAERVARKHIQQTIRTLRATSAREALATKEMDRDGTT